MVRELYIQEQQEEGFTACCLTRTVGLTLSEGGFRARDVCKLWTLPQDVNF